MPALSVNRICVSCGTGNCDVASTIKMCIQMNNTAIRKLYATFNLSVSRSRERHVGVRLTSDSAGQVAVSLNLHQRHVRLFGTGHQMVVHAHIQTDILAANAHNEFGNRVWIRVKQALQVARMVRLVHINCFRIGVYRMSLLKLCNQ